MSALEHSRHRSPRGRGDPARVRRPRRRWRRTAAAGLVAAGVWEGVLRRGWGRVAAGLAVAGTALAGVFLLMDEGYLRTVLLLGLGALVLHATARSACRADVVLPLAERPRRPVVVINPHSGERPGGAGRTGDGRP